MEKVHGERRGRSSGRHIRGGRVTSPSRARGSSSSRRIEFSKVTKETGNGTKFSVTYEVVEE